MRPTGAVEIERKRQALRLLADVKRLDAEIVGLQAWNRARQESLGHECDRSVWSRPEVAAFLIGRSGDVRRFTNKDHYAL